jgi:hypothetical protein
LSPGEKCQSKKGVVEILSFSSDKHFVSKAGKHYFTQWDHDKKHREAVTRKLEIDLRSQQVTFPLRFETTLGVTAETYTYLTLLGVLASGALGGGWFWQLLSWIKSRHRKTPSERGNPAQL